MEVRCLNCMKTYGEQYEVCPHCGFIKGTPPKEAYHLSPGVTLQKGRYTIGTVINYGGFGIVYRAWDEQLSSMIAIKEYYPAGTVQRTPGKKDIIVYAGNGKKVFEDGVERFLDEARNMAKFSENPNIVNVYNFFEENNTAYFVMEFMDGVTLKQYLKAVGGKVEVEQATEIISTVCDALKDIHKEGIIHRDIAPDNIFILVNGKIKLFDFGAARFSTGDEEKTLSIVLKPGYAPPEQYQSKSKQGPWTDVYALAATMYHMVAGVRPEESVNRKVEDTLLPPASIDPAIPVNLSNSIMKGMALEADLRFRTVQDFQDAILDKKKVLEVQEELRRRKSKRVLSVALVIALLLLGAVYGYELFKDKKEKAELPPTTLSMWVPAEESELNSTKELYESMAAYFLNDQPAVQFEVTAIESSIYEQELETAMENGTMPTLYVSDGVSREIIDGSADLSDVFQFVSLDNYYFLNHYEDYYPAKKQLPLGFTVPVVFVRYNMGVDLETAVFDDYELLRSNVQEEAQDALSYYIEPEAAYLVFSSFDGGASHNGTVSDEVISYRTKYLEDLTKYSYSVGDTAQALADFSVEENGTMTYYIGTTQDVQVMNTLMPGRYEMRPIQSEHAVGLFCNCISISGSASRDDRYAASMLISYLMEPGAQKDLHIGHRNAIPLQKDAYEEFVGVNGKYTIITDYYLDVLEFEGEEQESLKQQLELE